MLAGWSGSPAHAPRNVLGPPETRLLYASDQLDASDTQMTASLTLDS